MKVIKNISGLYFLAGRGFTARIPQEATAYNDNEVARTQECIASCGLGVTTAETLVVATDPNIKQNANGISYAVSFVRKSQLRADGSINAHKLNPSKRRFATEDEANYHGCRFKKIEGHLAFYVTTTRDAVNAYVNKVTGFTNPEIGKKRLGATRVAKARV